MPTVQTTISSVAVSASTPKLKLTSKLPTVIQLASVKCRPSSPNACAKSVW